MSNVASIMGLAASIQPPKLEYIGHKWGASSVTVTRGVDYEEGDLLFSYMQYYSNVSITDEAGWTLINSGLFSVYQSFAYSYIIATANTSYTTNNGNRDNVIVVFRPTDYNTFTRLDRDYGMLTATIGDATINMTDTNDSLYMGFGASISGSVTDITVPPFANVVDVTGAGGSVKFYWAHQRAGHGNTGSQVLEVEPDSFGVCTATQLDLIP